MAALPYFIIPTTEAPAQTITITLNNQSTVINLYTKSTYIPIAPGGATAPINPGVTFSGAIADTTLTASGTSAPLLFPGMLVYGNSVGNGTLVLSQLTGPTGGDGTYQLNASQTVASTAMMAFTPPPYDQQNPCFVDLYVNKNTLGPSLIVGGVYVRQGSLIVRDTYLGFSGDLAVYDTSGAGQDPYGVPPVLPPPDLRNPAQLAAYPLSDGNRAPVTVAGRIPGMGSRFVLTYWPAGTFTPGYSLPR